jgi:hypothetical protein
LNKLLVKLIDPNKLLELTIKRTERDGLEKVLSNLKNLRSLTLEWIEALDEKQLLFLLTKMRGLTSLSL